MTHPDILRAEATGYADEDNRKAIYTCEECGYAIYEGDKYFYAEKKGHFCKFCLDEMSIEDLLDLCGESLSTAE